MTVQITNGSAVAPNGAVTITELDGTPLVTRVEVLKFSNTSVTDNEDGSVSISTGAGGGGDVSSNTATSVDGEVALFSGTGGKTVKRSNLTGLLKSSAGVLQAATPGTDYAVATTGTSILKGDNAGGFSLAVAGTDYLAPAGNGSQLTGITKAQVGLGNADNTSDANKPISTATQTALDLKAPKNAPSFTGDIRSLLLSTENILIDARTNPRGISLGVFRINHTAGIAGTRPISIDVDANGHSNTHACVVDFKATGISSGETHLHEVNIDSSTSTGGELEVFTVSKTGAGLIDVTAFEVYPDINVLNQRIGDPISLAKAWKLSGVTYTDVTADLANGTNVSLFNASGDYVICGHDTAFGHLEVYLDVPSSHTIDATFEYSNGEGSWAAFTPADGSNGFTTNGTITWDALPGWVAATVNGVSKYYIRIRRTRNMISTVPVEDNIRIVSTTVFGWDKTAKVSVSKIKATGLPMYANRAAALAGGLVTGDFYKTSDGTLMVA